MSTFVEKMAAEGALTPEQVERIGSSVADFIKEAEADPELRKQAFGLGGVGHFAHDVLEQADWKKMLGGLAIGAGLELGGRAIGAGVGAARGALQGHQNAIQAARSYKEMLEANPDLSTKDTKTVQRAFATLHRFNPEYASDPLVSGSFVRNAADRAMIPIDSINQIVNARRSMAGTQGGGNVFKNLPTNLVQWGENPEVARQRQALHQQKMEEAERAGARGQEAHQGEMREREARLRAMAQQEAAERARQQMYLGAKDAFHPTNPDQLGFNF